MIGNSENRISFNGNGSATEFSYQFKILNKTDIKVLLVDNKGKETLLNKDYYVDTEKSVVHYPGYAPGAEIPEAQRPPVLQNGWKLILYREVPVTQESRLDEYWPFNVIESMADKLTIICQQLLDGVSRSIKISEGSKSGIDTVIDVAPNKGLKWNAEGTKIVATVDPADVLPQANDVLKQTEAARDKAIQKADAAAESALSAADSERNADTAMNKARAWAEGHEPGGASTKSSKEWATEASTKATEATEQAQLAKWWAQGHMPENNPANQSAKEWAKASEIHADIATEKAELATQKATEIVASANTAKANADAAKASETAAKSSETKAKASEIAAKASETAAKSSETKAKASETNAGTSANKATTEANRAKTEADRAKTAADSVGNPVVSITQSGGNLTVTKGDGSSDTLTVTPAKASQAEAEAGTSNDNVMTPLRTKQAIEAFDNTPVGDVVFRPYLKKGYVKANGATVNRADYPRLVAFANANNLWTTNPANEPWKFGQGNGSTTMVLPNYIGRFIQGGDTPTIKEAGLPNITGEFSTECGSWPWYDHPNSAIYQNGLISNNGGLVGGDTDDLVKFDASRSNSIYGNSSTVQPPSIQLIPQLRY